MSRTFHASKDARRVQRAARAFDRMSAVRAYDRAKAKREARAMSDGARVHVVELVSAADGLSILLEDIK